MSARYRLRLFFDPGSGVLAWAGNRETEARFGYPIETSKLQLPEELAAKMERLIDEYDATFNWDDPAAVRPADVDSGAALIARLREIGPRIAAALGPEFEVVVER